MLHERQFVNKRALRGIGAGATGRRGLIFPAMQWIKRGQPTTGLVSLAMVFMALALGHSLVVTQWHFTPDHSLIDTAVSMVMGLTGFVLVWIGLKKPEVQATMLGYIGGNLIWIGWFEWTWHYFGYWMGLEGIQDKGFEIIAPGLMMIQSTALIVIAILVFLGANKDTRCRMFMWFHRNFKLRPGRMTPGYKRQHARTTAIETVFLIWFIYLCAIMINDPRVIGYDSVTAMVLTGAFIVWGIYLARKLLKVNGLGATFRYAIPTGNILWLPIEALARWGIYPEVWIKPIEYPFLMSTVLAVFAGAWVLFFLSDTGASPEAQPA